MNSIKVVMLGPSLKQQGGMATVENLILDQTIPGIEVQHISTHDEGSINHRGLVFGRAIHQFLGKLIRAQVDLVHIHLSEKGSAIRKAILVLLALAFRKPVVMHAHGCEFHTFYLGLPTWAQQALSWILQRCDRFIVLSKSWQDFYVSTCGLDPAKVVVLPNPVELPQSIVEQTGTSPVKLIFLGRIGQRKGAFDLLRAFAQLPPALQAKANLILAGDGDVSTATNLVQELHLTPYVTLPGWINSSQRNQLLSQANVFVLPSYNEGLPMALLEAMSWGLPVITTPVGGIPEVVTHLKQGFLVKPGDTQQLAEAIQALIEHEALRVEMGQAARQQVLPLSMTHYCTALVNLYETAGKAQKRNFRPA